MRALIVYLIIALSLPIAFFRPFYGTLLWSWAAYFRPQDLAWNMKNTQLSKWIAIVTVAGLALALVTKRERVYRIFTREVVLMAVMLMVIAIVCSAAFRPDLAWPKFDDYWKIFLMTFLTVLLVTDKERLRMTFWVIALSLGALGLKGGLLGALRGAKIQGPGGFLLDNNDFALALNMSLPLLYYLTITEKEKLHRWAFGVTTFFTAIAVVLTNSRGGFLGLCTVSFLIAWKSPYRAKALASLAGIGFVGAMSVAVARPDYVERLWTITEWQEDGSALGRINAWETCWNIGNALPFTGVGPRNLDLPETFEKYSPNPGRRHVAHNIYFQTLSDGGFTLLGIFLLLLLWTWRSLRTLRRVTPKLEENAWFLNYTHALEVALGAYVVSGFFLSRNDFDLYYHMVGITIAMKLIAPRVLLYERPVVVDVEERRERPSLRPQFGQAGSSLSYGGRR